MALNNSIDPLAHKPPSGDALDIYDDEPATRGDIDPWGNDWGGAGDHADIEYLVIDD